MHSSVGTTEKGGKEGNDLAEISSSLCDILGIIRFESNRIESFAILIQTFVEIRIGYSQFISINRIVGREGSNLTAFKR